MFAMAGAPEAHNMLVSNAVGELRQQFRLRSCRVYPSDMRVRVNSANYTYPDVVAVCGDRQFADNRTDTLLNPALLIEVPSPSTEAYDRGRKFEQYKAIQSLREYLLITSDRIHTDLYTRMADGRWILTSADSLEDSLRLESVDAHLTLADLYEKVEFPDSDAVNLPPAPPRTH
jgi:Uma2 family endonuclease